jgi:16S rRNA (cytosine1402-N4)-methyltransferase
MTIHKPVLLNETIELLNLKTGMVVIDATLGGGGHSQEILKKIGKSGWLISFDADTMAIKEFEKEKERHKWKNISLVNANFRNLIKELEQFGVKRVDAILADIGYSSDQLEDAGRGISFQIESPLDMRFDKNQELTAEKVINEYGQEILENILRKFGEERFAKNISRGILEYRKEKKIRNTKELVDIIENSTPKKYHYGKIHPATKTFQAFRIEVNRELESLQNFLPQALDLLKSGGRLAVISFHSLEDRIVKEIFRENARGCICPKDFPVCLCNKTARVKIITKKPLMAGEHEIEINPRSRSAKLRVCELI